MTTVTSRYDMRQEPDGTWTVFDIFTGQPVELNGAQIMCLTMEEAEYAIDLLNHLEEQGQVITKQ